MARPLRGRFEATAGQRRLLATRALVGGAAAAVALPAMVAHLGGGIADAVGLAAAYAIGCALTEVPTARGARADAGPRSLLARSAGLSAVATALMALAPSLVTLAMATALAGMAAGIGTSAEARATLALVSTTTDPAARARTIARFEVLALFGKSLVCVVIAAVISALRLPPAAMLYATSAGLLLAAAIASTLRNVDRAVPADGRRSRIANACSTGSTGSTSETESERRARERRAPWSIGVLALLTAAVAFGLAARGTDGFDVAQLTARTGGPLLPAALLAGKALIAHAFADRATRPTRVHLAFLGALSTGLLLTAVLIRPAPLPFAGILVLGCGAAAGAAAGARALMMVRLGPERAGVGVAVESTARRLLSALALVAMAASAGVGFVAPYVLSAGLALVGATLSFLPQTARARERA